MAHRVEEFGRHGASPARVHVQWTSVGLEKFATICRASDIRFFFEPRGGRTSKAGGRVRDGRTWEEFPQRTPQPDRETAATRLTVSLEDEGDARVDANCASARSRM